MNDVQGVRFADSDVVEKTNDACVLVCYAKFLRSLADKDYISARLCFKYCLTENFLWNASQAIEKYAKSILLFNTLDVIQPSHRFSDILNRAMHTIGIDFEFDADECALLQYINDVGAERYALRGKFVGPSFLSLLDSCVWKIRLFCRKLHADFFPTEQTEFNVTFVGKDNRKSCCDGYIEGLANAESVQMRAQYEILCWNNRFFGQELADTLAIISPPLVIVIDWYEAEMDSFRTILRKYIRVPKGEADRT